MIIGVAKEIKPHEYRVALTPDGVRQLIGDGHRVLVEFDAGSGSGFDDQQYRAAGGLMVHRADLFAEAELLVKIKEPLPAEYDLLRREQIVFTYLHLAPNRPLTDLLLSRGVTAFAYETLERNGTTPLLTPMSEIAGRMAPLMGSYYLQRFLGGTGILPSGVAGVGPARTLIIGAGTVGRNAACTSVGMGMETVMLNRGAERLRAIELEFHAGVRTGFLVDSVLEGELARADVVIGAVYATGGRTPLVITRQMLGIMRKGSVIVDVAIDQGGCAESSRPTSHDNPVFTVDGIIHYCVANMPGAYPRTSTLALTSATLPYIRLLARHGKADPRDLTAELRSSLNIYGGEIMHPTLADALK